MEGNSIICLLKDRQYIVQGNLKRNESQSGYRCTAEYKMTQRVYLYIGEVMDREAKNTVEEVKRMGEVFREMKHKSLPKLLSTFEMVDEVGKKKYIVQVTEEVEGESLEAHVKKLEKLEAEERINDCMDIVIQLMEGILYLRKKGMVHRLINPSSVVIEAETGCPKICGFYMIDSIDPHVLWGKLITGKPNAFPPELFSDYFELESDTTDVWGLGMVFYYLLFGKYPWEAMGPSNEGVEDWIEHCGPNLAFPENEYPPHFLEFIKKTVNVKENRMEWKEFGETLREFKPTSQVARKVQLYYLDTMNACFEAASHLQWVDLKKWSSLCKVVGLLVCRTAYSYESMIDNRYKEEKEDEQDINSESLYNKQIVELLKYHSFYYIKYQEYFDPVEDFEYEKIRNVALKVLGKFMAVFQSPEYVLLKEEIKISIEVCQKAYTAMMLYYYDGEDFIHDVKACEGWGMKKIANHNKSLKKKAK